MFLFVASPTPIYAQPNTKPQPNVDLRYSATYGNPYLRNSNMGKLKFAIYLILLRSLSVSGSWRTNLGIWWIIPEIKNFSQLIFKIKNMTLYGNYDLQIVNFYFYKKSTNYIVFHKAHKLHKSNSVNNCCFKMDNKHITKLHKLQEKP